MPLRIVIGRIFFESDMLLKVEETEVSKQTSSIIVGFRSISSTLETSSLSFLLLKVEKSHQS